MEGTALLLLLRKSLGGRKRKVLQWASPCLPAVNPWYWSEPLLLLVWAIACWPFLLTRPPSSTVSEWANWYLLLKWASPLEVDSSPVPLLHSDRPRKLFFYFWDFLFYVQIRICSGNDRGTDMWPLPTLCIPCCHFCKLCSLVCFCVQSHVCKSSQLFCLEQSTLAPVCGLSEKRFEYNTQILKPAGYYLKATFSATTWPIEFFENPRSPRDTSGLNLQLVVKRPTSLCETEFNLSWKNYIYM